MNYGDLIADNEDLPSLGGRMVPSSEKFKMLFKHIFIDRIVQIFNLNNDSKDSFELLLDKKIENSINFGNIEDELFLILNISNRYLMIEELLEKKSDINFGLFGILFYLGLTCFDSLGQEKEYIQYQDWLNSKKNKEVAGIEKLIRKSPDSNLREELNNLYINYFSPIYGVKNSFFNFLNQIKDKESYRQLLLSINLSNFVSKQIGNDLEFTERFKKDWLFSFRNNFTHNTQNIRIPLEKTPWKLSYQVKKKRFYICIKPSETLKKILNCVKDGIEMKLNDIGLKFEHNHNNPKGNWQSLFIAFNKVFTQFERFVTKKELNQLEMLGLIKSFEYIFDLSWKTLQDLLKEKGYIDIIGPRPVIEQSFQDGYIADGKGWMQMHKSRNLTSHTYDEETAKEIVAEIKGIYFSLLEDLKNRLEKEV